MGFTLHAATIAPRHDPRAKEALLRYVMPPPLAQERVTLAADSAVRLGLKRAFSDGTIAVELQPLSFLCRLAAAVPGPGFHTVLHGGILSSAATWRPLVVPDASEPAARQSTSGGGGDGAQQEPRSTWRPWKELLKRSFGIEIKWFQMRRTDSAHTSEFSSNSPGQGAHASLVQPEAANLPLGPRR